MASLTLPSLFTCHPTNFRPAENSYVQIVNLHGTIKTALHSLCILQERGGAKDIFFKGKILEDAPTSYRIFDNPPLEQKKTYNHRPPPPPPRSVDEESEI